METKLILNQPKLFIIILTYLSSFLSYAQKNLLENAGFENGSQIPSWHYREIYKEHAIAIIDTDHPYQGKSSLKLSMPILKKRAELEQKVKIPYSTKSRHFKVSLASKVDTTSSALGLIYFYQHGKLIDWDIIGKARFINKDWKHFENHIFVPAGIDSITINLRTYGAGSAWFDNIKMTEVKTNKKPTDTVKKVVDEALQFAKNTYWKRDSVDWKNVEAQTLFMASGTGDNYYPAIKALISTLGDEHASIKTAEQILDMSAKDPKSPTVKLDLPSVKLLPNNYVYINVTACMTFHPYQKKIYADTLLSQIRALDKEQNLNGWIVDLRDNFGGLCDPMLAGLSPLFGPGFIISQKNMGKEKFGQLDPKSIPLDGNWGPYSVEPYWVKKKLPMAVLTGSKTASSAEVVLIAFKGCENTLTFGEATAGVPTAPTAFHLPDKGTFSVTGTLWCDKNGKCYSEAIPPDIVVTNPQNERLTDKDPVIKAAIEWLNNNSAKK